MTPRGGHRPGMPRRFGISGASWACHSTRPRVAAAEVTVGTAAKSTRVEGATILPLLLRIRGNCVARRHQVSARGLPTACLRGADRVHDLLARFSPRRKTTLHSS